MNAVVDAFLADEEFFAPSTTDFVDGLIAQYRKQLEQIKNLASIMRGEQGAVVHYFTEANADRNFFSRDLWDEAGAIKALDAAFWSKAITATDLLNYMPQNRRNEWNEQIRTRKCPAFEEDSVRATLQDLLGQRHLFFAERVDGIFRNLSGEHVTNSPSGFSKRMIFSRMTDGNHPWYFVNHQRVGYINDLRCVIAKFMGRDEPCYRASEKLVESLKGNWGEWVQVDGNAFKIRLYKKGTAHIEVHPDMAWKLNGVLAHLYPSAIPSEFRTKPKRTTKKIDLIQRPLPFAVIDILAGANQAVSHIKTDDFRQPYRKEDIKNAIRLDQGDKDKYAMAEARKVLESIGGVEVNESLKYQMPHWKFDYFPLDVIRQIVNSGLVPDDKSHQYYPTPESVASFAIKSAEIDENHTALEPSAGIGNLADLMPNKSNVTCVEVSEIRYEILKIKGFNAVQSDFIQWSLKQQHETYDRIVMNPPFDRGQWQSHLDHALPLLKRGGRLIAILPESANGKINLQGLNVTYLEKFNNEFAGTSVSVVVVRIDKP